MGRLRTLALALALAGCGAEGGADDGDAGGASTGGPVDESGTTGAEAGASTGDGGTLASDASSEAGATSTADSTGDPPQAGARYHEVRQKSSHNSFQRHEAPFDMLVWHRVRSLEFDIHVGKTFESTQDGEWFVYHTDITDDETWCVHLTDCLTELAVLGRAVPEHEVVTVWIDLKDDWGAAHGPAELDALLAAVLGDRVFAPAELQAYCPGTGSVQSAALECGWPPLAELRGRVIVVLTGGAGSLADYDGTAAFVAPAIAAPADMAKWPQTAFFNAEVDALATAADIASAGGVVRVYGLDDEDSWAAGVAADVHHLATDMVNGEQDPWAVTHDADGWPFTCRSAAAECTPSGPEPAAIVGIAVDSGDVWSTADDAWLLHVDRSAAPDGTWTAFVATENSWVEPFAKGCLVARASVDPGAPYFAVCRPADDGRLRVQTRTSQGATSTAVEADIALSNTIDPEGVVFVRLRITDGGTCVAGDGSRDGETWVEIDARCFAAPLGVQGITASSHDGGIVRVLFGELRLDDGPALGAADFASTALGDATAQVYDGVRP